MLPAMSCKEQLCLRLQRKIISNMIFASVPASALTRMIYSKILFWVSNAIWTNGKRGHGLFEAAKS